MCLPFRGRVDADSRLTCLAGPRPIWHRAAMRWLAIAFFCCSGFVQAASAQNPNWPPPEGTTREELMDPANWPDDSGYGYAVNGMQTCIGDGMRCWDNPTGGQWNFWSWMPPEAMSVEGFRTDEIPLGAGTWTDMAWTLTTGERSVVIAVIDSGIEWDRFDIINQHYLNMAELSAAGLDPLCLPPGPEPDKNGDGFVNMTDWFVGLDADATTALREQIDSRGNGNGHADPGDLITICSDGVDDDGNGYTDDISGWDVHHDDNDPADDVRYGHGSGEARDAAGEGNNGAGEIGYCPHCRILMVRAGDSFIVDAQDYAQAVVYAVDAGASVILEATGSLNNTTFMRRAMDYAYNNGVMIAASAADENSFHHNMPGTADHTLYVHATRYAGAQPQTASSFQAYNNCTNYGAQLDLSAPGTGCSSEATAVTAGIAGLVYSAAVSADRPGGPLDPPLSAEEAMQVLKVSADDIHVPESDPDHPEYNADWYPSREGWDQRFGYGRINAYEAVKAVREGAIPPEVDLYSPDWFRVIYPAREPSVTLRGSIDARRASSFDYVIEWAPGIEPDDDAFTTLAMGAGATERLEGDLATWDVSGLEVDNGSDVGAHNRYTVTVRIRVTANYGGSIGQVRGEQRRAFAIVPDDTLLPGFPIALGTRNDFDLHPGASGEASPKLFDLDGDGALEIIYGDADGLLHVIGGDGAEHAGFPLRLGTLRGHDPADPANVNSSAAFTTGGLPIEDLASAILAATAIGDLEGDGTPEIVATTMEGEIYVVEPDASIRAGFPIALPDVLSGDPLRMGPPEKGRVVERGAFASPVLADLDNDDRLEIIQAAFDGNVYVFREDGSDQAGFPVTIVADQLWMDAADVRPSRIMTSPAVGDANGDGLLDIAVGSNEIGDDKNSGAIHLIHGDGNNHAGGPSHDNWPVKVVSLELFPFVGRGTPSAVAMADVNGDERPDLAVTGSASRIVILDGPQEPRAAGEEPPLLAQMNSGMRGPLSNVTDPIDRPLLNTFANGAFGDFDQDGLPDFTTGGAGLKLAANLAGGYTNEPFAHQIGVWSTQGVGERRFGAMMPGFPQRIEDFLFFINPTSADVSGDGYPEVVVGSGGYWVHAWDACGREAPGWPKFVGSWVTASPALGDIDGDDQLEMVVTTRMGYLYAFDTDGPVDGAVTWPTWRHDPANTGNFENELSYGTKLAAEEPIECPIPETPDAGVDEDVGVEGDAGMRPPADDDSGCGCRVAASADRAPRWVLASLVLLVWRRRSRS